MGKIWKIAQNAASRWKSATATITSSIPAIAQAATIRVKNNKNKNPFSGFLFLLRY